VSLSRRSGTGTGTADPAYVAYHNMHRTLHGTADLEYDATIAARAQSYAEYMSPNGGGCSTHSSSGSQYRTNAGENLAWMSSQSPGNIAYLDGIQNWYGEVKDCGTMPGCKSGASGVVGHLTQLLWKGSTKVGCGQTSGSGGTCTVCQYSPPGNYNNQYSSQVADCDTSVAYKCADTKVCIPHAERCNGVTGQCGAGGDMWTGTQYYDASNNDEASCGGSTTPTPACTNTDGSAANSVACQCGSSQCGSYRCRPGPGAGATCLPGQYCDSAAAACSGTPSLSGAGGGSTSGGSGGSTSGGSGGSTSGGSGGSSTSGGNTGDGTASDILTIHYTLETADKASSEAAIATLNTYQASNNFANDLKVKGGHLAEVDSTEVSSPLAETTDDTADEEKSGMGAGGVVAIILCVLLVLGLAAGAAYYLLVMKPAAGGGLAAQDGNAVTVDMASSSHKAAAVEKKAPAGGKSVKELAGRWGN